MSVFQSSLAAAAFTFLSLPAAGHAHGEPTLHVGTDYESCYFDLHAELTESEFHEFAGEAGQIVRSRQLASAETLGKGTIDVSLGYAYFFLDDSKGAWNNTMSHPEADHYLGDQLGFPQLSLRAGVTDDIDVEAYGSVNWMSNYGFVGVAAKFRLLDQADDVVSLAIRPSVSTMQGPSEVRLVNASADVAVSRTLGAGFTPFLGATLSSTLAVETSDDVDLDAQVAARPLAFAGVEYRWRVLTAAAQAEVSDLTAFGLRVGGQF